ncbi:Nmad5 family putative nucleotide modification protein [Moraxella sp. Pampa]|uniref:Nmad5 family putative nucleotide modification protein n=1 Tax=Moraxella sp. Pampa TaxID=3111978 RepID=UPI002B415419|nr:Nmad5 family putative nucleotide modification protein [Moraxella sp. Pampa]
MARLTKEIKHLMVNELLKNGKFDDNIKQKEYDLRLAGDEIHQHIFGKYLDDVKKLPNLFFYHSKVLKLEGIQCLDNKYYFDVILSDNRVVLMHGPCIGKDFHGLTKDDAIIKKYLVAKQAYEDEQRKKRQAKFDAETMLSGINTFKQLWKVWPDSRSLLEKFEKSDRPNYPLVPQSIVNINAAFGLPVGK